MRLIKSVLQMAVIALVTVIAIDMIAYLGFKSRVQMLIPSYGNGTVDFDRGYPTYHFMSDDEIGFDIQPDFKTSTFMKPHEYKEYDVWGNSYGCFDDEWDKEDLQGGVYLAGDSFTWGYVSYETKFGTLLKHTLDTPVYSCGVSHTGQSHQFEKFKRLFQRGIKPEKVIVNVVWNDVNNDFFFPHTTVVDGYMVETVEQCGSPQQDNYSYRILNLEEAQKAVEIGLEELRTWPSLLFQYSLTANAIGVVVRKTLDDLQVGWDDSDETCERTVYGDLILSELRSDYRDSEFSKANRNAIRAWIIHAADNNYELIFSLIPSKFYETGNYPFIEEYISSMGGTFINFRKYIDEMDLDRASLYYNIDSHFNELGNEEYAKYLSRWILKDQIDNPQ